MTLDDIIGALALPPDARVDQRVPKKLFLEQGAPTSADKRLIQDGIEEVQWVAALKPANIGVPAFKDDTRDYLEIAVLTVVLRPAAKPLRLTELIHRAIPYPLLLPTAHGAALAVSAAHKRSSLGEAGKTVIDDAIVSAALRAESDAQDAAFLANLRLSDQPNTNLSALYQGWIDRIHALAAARLTGTYAITQSADDAAARRAALADHDRIIREIAALRARAAKETQINRRVDLNLAIQRLEDELTAATAKL
jgi:hypothetical protein